MQQDGREHAILTQELIQQEKYFGINLRRPRLKRTIREKYESMLDYISEKVLQAWHANFPSLLGSNTSLRHEIGHVNATEDKTLIEVIFSFFFGYQ